MHTEQVHTDIHDSVDIQAMRAVVLICFAWAKDGQRERQAHDQAAGHVCGMLSKGFVAVE